MTSNKIPIVDWESKHVLSDIAEKINTPIEEIIRLNKYILEKKHKKLPSEIDNISQLILESSEKIAAVVSMIIEEERTKNFKIIIQKKLKFSELYTFHLERRNLSDNLLNFSQFPIPKDDFLWLIELEQIVLDSIASSKLNLTWISTKMLNSERNLHRKIKKYTGITPKNYIKKLRLLFVHKGLESNQYSTVQEAANSIGFLDPYYFSKQFFKEFKVMPSEFLK